MITIVSHQSYSRVARLDALTVEMQSARLSPRQEHNCDGFVMRSDLSVIVL